MFLNQKFKLKGMVRPDPKMELEKDFAKLHIKFDRAAYRFAYDKMYFKKRATCPWCGSIVLKHHLKRHQTSKRCVLIKNGKT